MAATWTSLAGAARSVSSVQATTEAAPSAGTEGFSLSDVAAVTFWLEADSGQTLSGAGQVDVYAYDSDIGWGLAPLLEFGVPATASGKRRVVLGTVVIDNRVGRLAPIANGVTVSGGGVMLYARCTIDFHGAMRVA